MIGHQKFDEEAKPRPPRGRMTEDQLMYAIQHGKDVDAMDAAKNYEQQFLTVETIKCCVSYLKEKHGISDEELNNLLEEYGLKDHSKFGSRYLDVRAKDVEGQIELTACFNRFARAIGADMQLMNKGPKSKDSVKHKIASRNCPPNEITDMARISVMTEDPDFAEYYTTWIAWNEYSYANENDWEVKASGRLQYPLKASLGGEVISEIQIGPTEHIQYSGNLTHLSYDAAQQWEYISGDKEQIIKNPGLSYAIKNYNTMLDGYDRYREIIACILERDGDHSSLSDEDKDTFDSIPPHIRKKLKIFIEELEKKYGDLSLGYIGEPIETTGNINADKAAFESIDGDYIDKCMRRTMLLNQAIHVVTMSEASATWRGKYIKAFEASREKLRRKDPVTEQNLAEMIAMAGLQKPANDPGAAPAPSPED